MTLSQDVVASFEVRIPRLPSLRERPLFRQIVSIGDRHIELPARIALLRLEAQRAWRSWGLGRFSQLFDLHVRIPSLEHRA